MVLWGLGGRNELTVENHLEVSARGCQLRRDPSHCVSVMLLRTWTPLNVALIRCRRGQRISSSALKPGSPHHEDRCPLLLFPASRVVPQVLASLGFIFLIAETEKQCEERG